MRRDPFERLLRLYPRRFRERYGSELRAFLADDLKRSRRRGGPFWAARFRVRAYRDAVVASLRMRVRGGVATAGPTATQRSGSVGADAVRDLSHALRGFRRQPGFHGLMLVTVGLGVAAVTASFSVLDGLVRRPQPYPHRERKVRVATGMRHNP
jgi:hypothetical protein